MSSSLWEGPEVWRVGPALGISGFPNRSEAAGFHDMTSRFVVIFCKGKCAKYEIRKDDVFVTTMGFEISRFLHRLQKYPMQKVNNNKII